MKGLQYSVTRENEKKKHRLIIPPTDFFERCRQRVKAKWDKVGMQAHKNAGVFSIFTPFFENRLKGSGEKTKFFQVKKIPKYTQKTK